MNLSPGDLNLKNHNTAIRQLAAGGSNNTGKVTLRANQTTTVVLHESVNPNSHISLTPLTAHAVTTVPLTGLSVVKQVFTASGTYTPSANMVYCIIEGVGSGGAGGGVVGATTFSGGGGGGGAGSYSRLLASAATIGASQAVTIGNAGTGVSGAAGGAGSDCSLGALLIAKGGAGGLPATTGALGAGGAGGVAGTGDVVAAGAPGTYGTWNGVRNTATLVSVPGTGGSSHFGGGGAHTVVGGSQTLAGIAASNYGSGGSGAFSDATASSAAGGNGSKGIIHITEFCLTSTTLTDDPLVYISAKSPGSFTITHPSDPSTSQNYTYSVTGGA